MFFVSIQRQHRFGQQHSAGGMTDGNLPAKAVFCGHAMACPYMEWLFCVPTRERGNEGKGIKQAKS